MDDFGAEDTTKMYPQLDITVMHSQIFTIITVALLVIIATLILIAPILIALITVVLILKFPVLSCPGPLFLVLLPPSLAPSLPYVFRNERAEFWRHKIGIIP